MFAIKRKPHIISMVVAIIAGIPSIIFSIVYASVNRIAENTMTANAAINIMYGNRLVKKLLMFLFINY